MTLAYTSADADPAEVRRRLDPLRSLPPAAFRIAHADLITLNRDGHEYRWDTVAPVRLGA